MFDPHSSKGFWIGMTLSIVFHGAAFGGLFLSSSSEPAKIKLNAVEAAVLVRKGEPRPKHLLPRIFKPRPIPPPRERIVAKREPIPRRPEPPRRRRVTDEDLIAQAEKKLERQRSKEEEDIRGDDGPAPGQRDGHEEGTAPDASAARKGALYGAQLRSRIDRQKLPNIFTEQQIARYTKQIQLLLYITEDGQLRDAKIATSSGDSRFDSAMLNKVRRAAPFPRPPSEIWKLIKEGIEIGWQ